MKRKYCLHCFRALDPRDPDDQLHTFVRCKACGATYHTVCWQAATRCYHCGESAAKKHRVWRQAPLSVSVRPRVPRVINERLIKSKRRRRVRGCLSTLVVLVILGLLSGSGALLILGDQIIVDQVATVVQNDQIATLVQNIRDQIARQRPISQAPTSGFTSQHEIAAATATAQRQATLFATEPITNLSVGARWQGTFTSGGVLPAARLGANCVGFIKDLPDLRLNFSGNASILILYFIAANADTTLVVKAPNDNFFCDDDSYGNTNPQIIINNPMQGIYQIWIGSYNEGLSHFGTLYITSQVARSAAPDREILTQTGSAAITA